MRDCSIKNISTCCSVVLLLVFIVSGSACQNKQTKELDAAYEKLFTDDNAAVLFFQHPEVSSQYLLKKISYEKEPMKRAITINLLGWLKGKGVSKELIMYTTDDNWRVRFMAIDSIVKNDNNIITLLRNTAKNDNDIRVRGRAIMGLGEVGTKEDMVFIKTLPQGKDNSIKIGLFIERAENTFIKRVDK